MWVVYIVAERPMFIARSAERILDRLDAALAKAFEHDDYTDAING